ncbi:hypothetical protein MNBD_GAMMA20-1797 [hydrothermal vent metagenome]|uniref:Glycosyltransferase RgtA/B/C/D-like domain-containing protein n=1 Tax=hydrothermal vent metagenome TaxID=652676 RepID=A0A3B1ATR3_9ZZZZ
MLGLLLFVCAGYYAVPLADSDFWWHIAAGRDILQHGALPATDPFGVFPAADVIRSDTVLKGQWLGQVVLYGLFEAGGINAVVAFRVAVLLACIALIYIRARCLMAMNPLALWGVLALVALNASGFGGERPQLLSFLFAALFFVCIDLARRRCDWRWLLPLPLITVLWANSHGGVILGVVLLGLWSVMGWLDKSMGRRERAQWLAMSGVVFFASLLTPNGIQTYLYLFQLEGSVLQQRTSEYISALQVYELGYVWPQVGIYGYFMLAMAGLIGLLKLHRWREAAVVTFLAAISISSYRYFAFFLFIAAPYLIVGLGSLMPKKVNELATPRRIQALVAVTLVIVLASGTARGTVFRGGLYPAAYPIAIADSVEQQKLRGRAFNNLEWGGYLLWRLGGQVQPYIDGRMLDMSRFPPYTHILWATPQGIQLFNRNNFQLVILPYHGRFDPQRYKLIDYLATRRDWRLAYRDAQGVVFVRRQTENFFGGLQ